MTSAKEKAKELFYKFYDNKSTDLLETYLKVDLAKMSALIAVDEIIKYSPNKPIEEYNPMQYFKEVKKEIEKL